ncbi:hypothetical protein HJD18_03270 [Thermoleophilia bacterium SCSIO 60948]|nr:hypothetical protein HJD18_03270 [Thermoleophilia bacterium SCSIO 60948]
MTDREETQPERKPPRRRFIIVGGSDIAISVGSSSPRARRSDRPHPEPEQPLDKPARRRPETG